MKAKNFVAVKKYKDGGEAVEEYFETRELALQWIKKQETANNFDWMVGEYE